MQYAEIVEAILQDEELARVADDLRALVRPAIALTMTETADPTIGASRVGGEPDLPVGIAWPTVRIDDIPVPSAAFTAAANELRVVPPPPDGVLPLPFIAQLQLRDLKGLDSEGVLPTEGRLYVFYSGMTYFDSDTGPKPNGTQRLPDGRTFSYGSYPGIGMADPRGCFTLYVEDEALPLQTVAFPGALPHRWQYSALGLTTSGQAAMLPRVETEYIGEPGGRNGALALTDAEWNLYSERVQEELPNFSHLLGHVQQAQPYAMASSYKAFRPQLFSDLPPWEELKPEQQRAEVFGCRLLLQLESHDNGMWFGRAGVLFLFIRDADLRSRDFTKVWGWVQ